MSKPTSSRVLLPHTLAAMAKRVFVALLVLVTLTSVYSITRAGIPVAEAAAPTTLNFQARLMNASGSLVNDGTYNVEFKIYNASSSSGSSQGSCTGDANCLWTETRTSGDKIQVKNGYLSAYLGDISSLPTDIWNQQLYLTMNIGGTGAASWDGEMTPRIRLTSVPYAFRATIAESAETLSKDFTGNTGLVDFATMTADRTFLFPDTALATTGSPGTICVFNGAASNCPAATGSSYYIQNTAGSATPQTAANFNIQATNSGTDGTIAGILRGAAGGQTVDLLQFQATNGTVLGAVTATGNLKVASDVDTYSAGALNVGNSTATSVSICNSAACDTISIGTNADADTINVGDSTDTLNFTGTAINLVGDTSINGNVTIAATKSLTITGGNTASRPASPTEGMLYYDTDTDQLLTYANGKWQADRSGVTKIVAASNSSQAVKDAADYVADGTGDQVEINAALTAAAGGKVYLAEGTYVANATILVPNGTVLSGAGRGTLIELADLDATDNLIENSDTTTGTGVRIQDLRLDGRSDLNTAGTQTGITFNGMGAGSGTTARAGGSINGVIANNFRTYGINFATSLNNMIVNTRTQNNSGGGIGLDGASAQNTLTGNIAQGNVYGIVIGSNYNTITGNLVQGNTSYGIYVAFGDNNTITGNTVNANAVVGVYLSATANSNLVSGNRIGDNGGATTNNAVYIDGNSDDNSIVGNHFSDTSATTTNYAVNVFITTNERTYIANNILSGGSILDDGSGTVISNNVLGGGTINGTDATRVYNGQTNFSGNYMIQPTGTIELMKNTNVTGTLNITSNVDTNGSLTVGNADQFVISNTGVVTSGTWNGTAITDTYVADALTISSSGTVDWTALNSYPGACTAGSAVTQIGDTLTCTAFAGGSAADYIQNQNASAQTSSNYWVSGTGRADTSFLAPTFDVATAATLNIGTTNATAVSISKSGVTTTINGALTVTEAGTFNGGLTAASNFTVTQAGNVAFQRNTTDYTATGTQNDINFGSGALFRITSASALTITSIAGGADGRVITLANASSNTVTINNDSGGTAANRIITGTGASLSVPAGASVQLAYDSSSSRWRIIGGTATSGGGANQQLSNLSGTVAVNTSLNPYDDNLIDLGSSSYSWRTLYADTSVLTPRVDTDSATTLLIGDTTATAITLGRSGITTTNAGALTVSELLTGSAGATITGGALTLTGNAASSLTTSSGALTITSAAAATWSTAAGALTVDAATALNLGTSNATSLSISKTGVTTTVNGALTVTQASQFNGGVTVASDFTVTNAGNVAFQRNTTDITDTGTLNDVSLGTGVMFRLNGASTQTVTSFAGGADGRIITIINAAAQQALFNNDSCSGCTASNRIVTGTNGALALPPGGSILLGYDTAASRWRIIGGTAVSGGGANRQLNNLQGTIAVNASLTTGADNAIDLGSNSFSWRTLYADTSVLTPRVDTDSATTLLIGDTTATAITLGRSGITTTNAGALTVSELLTGSAGATISGGALSLTGNAASSLTTSSGALTITSAAAATWSTAAGNLTVDSAAALQLGVGSATSLSISRTGVTTTINGALTVTEAGTFNGGLTVASNFTVTNAGNLAFQRNTTEFTTTGTSHDVDLGTGVLFRINGATGQTITSITGGVDGRIITIINAGANAATIQNDSGGTAANRIITGTGGNLSVPAGASIQLAYDSSASRWRIIGGSAVGGGAANQQLSNLSGTTAVNITLSPNADNVRSLGSAATSWQSLYADTSVLTPTVDTAAAATLNLGTTTANAVSISRTGVTTTVNGALTVTQAGTFNGGLTSAGNFTVTNAGNVAFQRNTTDFTTTGTSNDVNLGTGVMFRLNGASAQTITSIQGGADGRVITLINAGANTAFIENDTGGTAANRIVTGTGGTLPIASGASIQLGYDSAASRWRVIGGSATAGGGANQQLSNLSGTVAINLGLVADTDNAIDLGSSSFGWRSLYADTSVLTPNLDTATATALNIGTSTATSIVIGQTGAQTIRIGQNGGTLQLDGTNFDLSTAGVITLAGGQTSDITTAAASTATGITIKPGNSTGSNIAGPTLTLQGGAATAGNANGGAVTISGGAGVGTGAQGLVNLSTTAFNTSTTQVFGTSGSLTAGLVDAYSTIPVSASATGVTVTIPAPAIATVGRVLYISNVGATNDFNISLAGTSITISLKPNTTATLIWNGNGWTAAGASSSTDLQSAYNNTLTSAGGAEIVLNPTGGAADGFTIRNNSTTPIVGGLLEVQSSVGTNLFSVNNRGTELAANGGAETSSSFSTDWTAAPAGGTVTRTTTAGQFVTGLAGVQVATTGANHGVRNNLSGNPVESTTYTVSFTVKASVAITGSNLNVQYSRDGGTDLEACTTYSTQNVSDTEWTKITCTITTDSTTATNPDLIIRQADGTSRNIWIDNLSFMRNDTTTQPSNVQIGGGNDGGPITLFTLDRASAPPVSAGDETYYGSMYYDTITGSIQCYEADGWGACGSPPDNIITLTPEYTGAVLNGNGVGVMTADICAYQGDTIGQLKVNAGAGQLCNVIGEARNYYRWTSPQATLQDYSIYVTYKLPSTFKEFADNNTMKLTAYRDDADDVDALVKMATYRKNSAGGLTLCGSETNITQSSGSWEQRSVTGSENSCSFAGGDYIIFKITMSSRNNTNVYVENLDFTFNNR